MATQAELNAALELALDQLNEILLGDENDTVVIEGVTKPSITKAITDALAGIELGSAETTPFYPAGNIASSNVQDAIEELDAEKASTSHVHAASTVTSTASGNLAATNVQAALVELQSDIDGRALASHNQAASTINSGTFDIARIPTGSTSTTVALGNHVHTAASVSVAPGGNLSSTTVQAALMELQTDINNIILVPPTNAATAISVTPVDNLTSTNAQAALQELQLDVDSRAAINHTHTTSAITGGTFDIARIPTGSTSTTVALGNHVHAATAVTVSPSGNLAATTVQAALSELQTDIDGRALTSHTQAASTITSGVFDVTRIPTGTTSTTVALGNHGHIAANIAVTPVGALSSLDVQSALGELQTDIDGRALTSHTQAATSVVVTPVGNLAATNAQTALAELQADIDGRALSAHNQAASTITSGVLDIARIPTGSTNTTVAVGNHTHSASVVTVVPTAGLASTTVQAALQELDGKIATGGSTPSASAITFAPVGGIASTDVQAALAEIDTEKAAATHNQAASTINSGVFDVARIPTGITSTTVSLGNHAHTAAAVTVTPTGNIAATTVQAAIAELDTEKAASAHTHAANTVSFTPVGAIAATNVQAAIAELETDLTAAISSATSSNYESPSTTIYNGTAPAASATRGRQIRFVVNNNSADTYVWYKIAEMTLAGAYQSGGISGEVFYGASLRYPAKQTLNQRTQTGSPITNPTSSFTIEDGVSTNIRVFREDNGTTNQRVHIYAYFAGGNSGIQADLEVFMLNGATGLVWQQGLLINSGVSSFLPTGTGVFTELTPTYNGHTHTASAVSGTFAINQIPTGSTSTTVALGNHVHAASTLTVTPAGNLAATNVQAALTELQTDVDGRATTVHQHSAADITSGVLDIARIPTGSAAGTVSPGNHTQAATTVTVAPSGNLTSTTAQAALVELQLDVDGRALTVHTHTGASITGTLAIAQIPTGSTSTTVALGNHTHTAASVGTTPSGNLTSTTVAAALNELQTDIDGRATTSHAHAAAAVTFTPVSGTTSTNVQAAIQELQGDINVINTGLGKIGRYVASGADNTWPSGNNIVLWNLSGATGNVSHTITGSYLSPAGLLANSSYTVRIRCKAKIAMFPNNALLNEFRLLPCILDSGETVVGGYCINSYLYKTSPTVLVSPEVIVGHPYYSTDNHTGVWYNSIHPAPGKTPYVEWEICPTGTQTVETNASGVLQMTLYINAIQILYGAYFSLADWSFETVCVQQ